MDMVTCRYCGIVPRGHRCPNRKTRTKDGNEQAVKFRNTKAWARKSAEVRQRDRHLCQLCLRNLYDTIDWLNYKTVEVHHIIGINEDYNRRLDNDNLISLCSYHHKMADKGEIPKQVLLDIVKEINEG